MALEEPKFEVLASTPEYEIRRYMPYLVAEVDVDGENAGNQAFRILAGYIFGDNDAREKMNMTAPVESRDDTTYAFVMEERYTMATLPAPSDDRIELRERPARIVAVRRFSGRWTDKNVDKHEQELLEDLEADEVEILGTVELARYDSPFKPWFLRRNEVIVPVHWPDGVL